MKTLIPLGDRLLVRRRKVGEKIGSGIIVAPDKTADSPTDIADVVYVPEHSFADKKLIENSENIINSLSDKASEGDSEALKSLLSFNAFLKIKSLKVGDCVMISKYVGTDFNDNTGTGTMTLVNGEDICAIVRGA